jgi:hypothetical protein
MSSRASSRRGGGRAVDRELLLVGLTALVGGGGAWLVAPLGRPDESGPAWRRERRAWRQLVAPLIMIALGSAMWLGWALQEPEATDERLALLNWVIAALVLALWARALARLAHSIVARPALPIAVVGIAVPRIVVDPALERLLDADAFAAALAHETAHVRHRDPLRIAIAQLATDLQWPWPQPRRRLASWRRALEETRDDEAVLHGTCPEDLAAAIIAVARWSAPGAGASLGDHPIERRVRRLLRGSPRVLPPGSRSFALLVTSGVIAALVVGLTIGDDLLALLPGVLR